jgi:hypothetical protein
LRTSFSLKEKRAKRSKEKKYGPNMKMTELDKIKSIAPNAINTSKNIYSKVIYKI